MGYSALRVLGSRIKTSSSLVIVAAEDAHWRKKKKVLAAPPSHSAATAAVACEPKTRSAPESNLKSATLKP